MKKKSTTTEPSAAQQQELFRTDVTWFHIFKELIRSKTWAKMSGSARSLYPVIKAHINWQDGNAFPSLDTLQEYSGLARTSVTRALKELETLGLLQRDAGKGRASSNYRVVEQLSVRDEEGRPAASVSFDYLPGIVGDAVAELKNFVVNGLRDEGKLQYIRIDNLTLNIIQRGHQFNLPAAAAGAMDRKQLLQGLKDVLAHKDSAEARAVADLKPPKPKTGR